MSNKGGSNPTNTGAPAWSSGLGALGSAQGSGGAGAPPLGGNGTPYVAPVGNVGGGSTTAAQGSIAAPQAGATGPAPAAGTDAYNSMNSQLTTGPMQAINNLIQGGGMNAQTQQALSNLLGTSGSNNAMNTAGSMFQNLGQSGTNNFQNVYGAAGQPGANQQDLSKIASGQMLMSNPYVDAIANRNKQDATANVNQMYAAGGRYGSGYNQDALTSAIGNVNNQLYGQEYENDAARQLTAANQISQEQTSRLGLQNNAALGVGNLQTAAAQGLGGLGSDAMKNWISAQTGAGQIGTAGTQNLNNTFGQLGNVQNNKLFDANQQLGVGNTMDQQTQQALTNYANQFTQGDMSDWARVGALTTGGTQVAGNYGTTTGQQKQTSQAGIGSIVGGLLSML